VVAFGVCVAASLAACGSDSTTTMNGSDGGGFPDAVVTGDPMIVSFTASSMSVAPFESVDLTWSVSNAEVVDIAAPDGTLVSTFADQGTVRTSPMSESTTYTLTARTGAKSVMATLTVTVTWPLPVIDMFNAFNGPPFFIG